MATYAYSIIGDFKNGLNTSQLHLDIKNAVATAFIGITTLDDVVDIIFGVPISGGEQTILNNLITSHVPIIKETYTHIIKSSPIIQKTTSASYQKVDSIIYQGQTAVGIIKKIQVITYMDATCTSYSVKLYDTLNKNIVAENTFTNTNANIVELTPINNIPSGMTYFELCIKRNGGNSKSNVYIDSVSIYI